MTRLAALILLLAACATAAPTGDSVGDSTTSTGASVTSSTSSTTLSTSTTTTAPTTTTTTPTTTTSKPATTTTAPPGTSTTTLPAGFTYSIRTVTANELAHSWHTGCPVPVTDLRNVRFTFVDFTGAHGQGDLVVHRTHASRMVQVFAALFAAGYPIESVIPIGQLPEDAEDQADYSNTSAFHCRFVEGTTRWSEHAYGRAVDLNPHLNPLIQGDYVWPGGATRYVDRTLGEPGMIVEGDVVTKAFDSVGWGWGGRWNTMKDLHHFSSTSR